MRDDIKWQKAEDFALKIIELYKYLSTEKREFVISKQILRSGTSIGANIIESEFSESQADFIHKLSISQKEAGETLYWLRLLVKADYLDKNWFDSLYKDGEEIIRILTSIIVRMKRNNS
ncbi:MAG: four helix bundle protein [Muribaculaceae bacterium]|nr:four helix bundle protein [Muribaculaceae bacterium]